MARAACSNDFEENAITLSYDLQPKEEHSIVSAFSLITKEGKDLDCIKLYKRLSLDFGIIIDE